MIEDHTSIPVCTRLERYIRIVTDLPFPRFLSPLFTELLKVHRFRIFLEAFGPFPSALPDQSWLLQLVQHGQILPKLIAKLHIKRFLGG